MGNVIITLKGKMRPYTDILVNDKVLKFKKVKKQRKTYSAVYETEDNNVELLVKSYSFLHTGLWFIGEMFFFIISVFGIFDMIKSRHTYNTNCKIKVNVDGETNINLKLLNPRNNEAVIKYETDANIEEIENNYTFDAVAKKRKKILKIFKILTILSFIIAGIVLIIVL